MIELIAVDGATLGHKTGSIVSSGTFTILPLQASLKAKVDGKGVYTTPIQYTFAGGNATGFDPGTVYTVTPQEIEATAVKTAVDGALVMRLGDYATMACKGVTAGGGPVADVVGALVEISDAGQDKAKAD